MWHDFFFYRRGERLAILLLVALIGMAVGGVWLMGSREPTSLSQQDSAWIAVADSFYQHLKPAGGNYPHRAIPKRELDYFDPNTADSLTLIRLGLPRYVAHNILQYRRKGGHFRTPLHFSRVYGLDSTNYQLLRPYIRIDTTRLKPRYLHYRSDSIRLFYPEKFKEVVYLDLNEVDTTLLMKVPGIGRGFAHLVIHYREQLGGFYSVNQLKEIRGVSDSLLQQWRPWFYVDSNRVQRIDVNKAGVTRLRNHPYLNFYQAKVIYELRRKTKRLTGLEELYLLEEFTAVDFERLKYYLCFE